MAHKPKTDWDFLRERAPAEAFKQFNNDAKRAILDLLRSDVPLSAAFREVLANNMERDYFFPPSRRQAKKQKRDLEARIFDSHIEMFMRAHSCSKIEALKEVARLFTTKGVSTGLRLKDSPTSDPVEALKQRLKRARRMRTKGTKIR